MFLSRYWLYLFLFMSSPLLSHKQLQPLLFLQMTSFLWLSSTQCHWNNHWTCALKFQKSRVSKTKQWHFLFVFSSQRRKYMPSTPCYIKRHWKKCWTFVLGAQDRCHVVLRADFDIFFWNDPSGQEGMSHFPAVTKDNRAVHIFSPLLGLKCLKFPENHGGEENRIERRDPPRPGFTHVLWLCLLSFPFSAERTVACMTWWLTHAHTRYRHGAWLTTLQRLNQWKFIELLLFFPQWN